MSLADAVRQITAGSYEGSSKWLTVSRNQDTLNYAAQQASVNNPDLFNTECSVMPVIAYLADHKAQTLETVSAAAESFATTHGSSDRHFLLAAGNAGIQAATNRSEEHTSELQSLMRISYAVFCLKKKN